MDERRLPGLEVSSPPGGFARERSTERRLLRLRLKRQTLRGPGDPLGTKNNPNRVYTITFIQKTPREDVKEGKIGPSVRCVLILGASCVAPHAHVCSSGDCLGGKMERNNAHKLFVSSCHPFWALSTRFGTSHPRLHEEDHIHTSNFLQVQ